MTWPSPGNSIDLNILRTKGRVGKCKIWILRELGWGVKVVVGGVIGGISWPTES